MKSFIVWVSIIALGYTHVFAQKIATLEVSLPKSTNGLALPANIELDKITFNSDSSLALVEVNGNKRTPVPCQISQGVVRTLNWIITPIGANAQKRVYE